MYMCTHGCISTVVNDLILELHVIEDFSRPLVQVSQREHSVNEASIYGAVYTVGAVRRILYRSNSVLGSLLYKPG